MSDQQDQAPLPALATPVGIKLVYAQHASPLDLKVRVSIQSATLLDMEIVDEDTGAKVFEVYGKLASWSREAHIKAADGTVLYKLRQKKASLRYAFNAFDAEVSSATDTPVFTARAKGGLGKTSYDLDITLPAVGPSGQEQTLSLKTGIVSVHQGRKSRPPIAHSPPPRTPTSQLKDVSDILDAQGQTIAQINRSRKGSKKYKSESYWAPALRGS